MFAFSYTQNSKKEVIFIKKWVKNTLILGLTTMLTTACSSHVKQEKSEDNESFDASSLQTSVDEVNTMGTETYKNLERIDKYLKDF